MSMSTKKKSIPRKVMNTRVQYSPDELAIVKQAARKRLLSFNAFTRDSSLAVARRILAQPDSSVVDQIAAEIFSAPRPSASSTRKAEN